MKYCTNCGQVLPDFAKFCPMCGAEQVSLTEEPKEETPIVEVAKEEPVEAPIKEEIKETPIEESKEEVLTEEKPIVKEKPSKEPVKKVTPKQKNKFIDFIIYKDQLKYSIIFLAGLFAISLLFWILGANILVFDIFKLLVPYALSLATLGRTGYILYLEIKTNRFKDLYTLVVKSVFATAHFFLLILNIIHLVAL